MSRKADQNRLSTLQKAIETHPGRGIAFFVRLLGWPFAVVIRVLTSLNDRGVLLSEDEKGGLWPFSDKSRK